MFRIYISAVDVNEYKHLVFAKNKNKPFLTDFGFLFHNKTSISLLH